jgi:hypothetical protein
MEQVQGGYVAAYADRRLMIGNAQLLEATAACPQVFQRYGRSHLKVAQQLHASIFRSKLSRG